MGFLEPVPSGADQATRAAVNPIDGQVGVDGGVGPATYRTQRVVQASDAPGVADGWSIYDTPAVNTAASATKAPGIRGMKHVARTLVATLAADPSSAPSAVKVLVRIKDGSTVIWEDTLVLKGVAAEMVKVVAPELRIPGTEGNAMTVEFSAAGGANTFESVSLSGYSVHFPTFESVKDLQALYRVVTAFALSKVGSYLVSTTTASPKSVPGSYLIQAVVTSPKTLGAEYRVLFLFNVPASYLVSSPFAAAKGGQYTVLAEDILLNKQGQYTVTTTTASPKNLSGEYRIVA